MKIWSAYAVLGLLSACATFPPDLALDQLKAAKATDPKSDAYLKLADLDVACPARPKNDAQRDIACAQLWAFKGSGCLGDQRKTYNAYASVVEIPPDADTAIKARRACADTASANAVAFLPTVIAPQDAASALKVLVLRASVIETRRQYREQRSNTSVDDAELGATAVQISALPGGAPYADFLTAGTFLLQGGREPDKARACALANTGLQLVQSAAAVPQLHAASLARSGGLNHLKKIRACL